MTDKLTIKLVSGTSDASLYVHVDLASASVLSLKQLIEQQDSRRFPVVAQRLIFQGQILHDDKLLTEYHVTGGCALHLTLSPVSNTADGRRLPPSKQLQTLLQQMRDCEPVEKYAMAVRTFQKICSNIVDHPTEDKYRKLRIDNAMLKAKFFDRMGGQDCVKVLGFQDGVQAGHLVLVPTPDKWENLVACKAVVDSMATALEGAVPTAALPFGAMSSTSAQRDVPLQTQALLQNPAMLQFLASNPMVHEMSRRNPMLAQLLQNPASLAQSMQALQQNPAMMQQINQMVSNPNAMAQMQQMMEGGGLGDLSGGGASPFGGTALPSAAVNPFAAGAATLNPVVTTSLAPASTRSPAPAASIPAPAFVDTAPSSTFAPAALNDNRDEVYDEDEIAKAIARSLQDE